MTINYELAKKLKDAGFPHEHKEVCLFNIRTDDICDEITLSELIEACGDRFTCLMKVDDEWKAGNYILEQYEDPSFWIEYSEGLTPEEAVASLYLKLHEKN